MSYPQPQASTEILEGQNFFRLFTELVSSGDIYEMNASALAFCIGPQSDVARARVTYYDPSSPTKSSSFVVSVDSPFIGRIDRLGSQKYPIANVPANILISPEDLVNNDWEPPGSNPATQPIALVKPYVDLLAYFSDPPVTPARRADFSRRGRAYIPDAGGGAGVSYLVLPYYRRKYGSIKFNNAGLARAVDVVGVSFTGSGAPETASINTTVVNAGVITGGDSSSFEVRASQDGLFDYLSLKLSGQNTGAAGLYYDIVFTDEET